MKKFRSSYVVGSLIIGLLVVIAVLIVLIATGVITVTESSMAFSTAAEASRRLF